MLRRGGAFLIIKKPTELITQNSSVGSCSRYSSFANYRQEYFFNHCHRPASFLLPHRHYAC